ncbi:DUF3772 domain-containing protein [Pseudoruegeria sp. HB172150]|uniref:DUF3772 domain-containing protein n=1 Tax=Pseudoruegeria sp. HB172150 TaxID=2721164 RepID=UPI001556DBA5|nr:DUF3772 domain-containing protein [Pseudoruegeria sp. HB172150]
MRRFAAILILLLCLLAGGFGAPAAWAQDAATEIPPDDSDEWDPDYTYDAWDNVATRAEATLNDGTASNEELEELRAEMVLWRQYFLAAQDTNAAQISSLQDQLDALGPAPDDGETEATEITQRRERLTVDLNDLMVPVRTAEAAYRRAEAIIRQIDTLIRQRQTGELLTRGPTPANPTIWPEALAEVSSAFEAVWSEFRDAWALPETRQQVRKQLPETLFFLAVAALLVLRGRSAMVWLTQAVLNRSKGRARRLAAVMTSLLQVILPVLGLALLAAAIMATGLVGERGIAVAVALPLFGLFLFGARWLGLRLYPLDPDAPQPLPGTSHRGREMRFYITLAGLMTGLLALLERLREFEEFSPETLAVVFFPLFTVAGLVYVRIGRILSASVEEARKDDDIDVSFAQRSQRLIGQLVVILGIAGPVVALAGYRNLAYQMIVPTATTLALLGLLRILHDVVVELYAIVTRRSHEEAQQALMPSLLSFLLAMASLPLFALVWGARVADITEIWNKAQEGITIGDARISLSTFLTFLVVFGVLYTATRLFQAALKASILPKTSIDPGGQNAIVSGIGYLGIGLGVMIAVTTAGIDLSALAFVFGALSVGIGFGLQNIVSNFISGIILLVERPVAEGDWIEVGGHMGIVKSISVRSTKIQTFDRNDVIVPNADFISGAVKNWTRGDSTGRIIVTVGVAYGTDTRKVERILKEIVSNHPLVSLDPEPMVDFLEFGASSLDFQVRAVLPDIAFGLPVRTEIRHQIAERFAEEGIEIPFAQQDIWIRNAEALRPGKAVVPEDPDPLPEPPADDHMVPGDPVGEADSGEADGDST